MASRSQKANLVLALLNTCPEASDLPHSLCSLLKDIFPTWAKGLIDRDLELEEVATTPVFPLLTR